MRTTLTLDDDNAARLERLRKERDLSLKEVVNDAIRRGLNALDQPAKLGDPFRTTIYDPGEPLIQNMDNVADVLALIEGEDFK